MRAARAYGSADRETSVMVANSVGLVILLYEKLLSHLAEARDAFSSRDVERRSRALTKAVELIELGLVSSLDLGRGGDVAVRLKSHYELWIAKLFRANMQATEELVSEVEKEVRMLNSAWVELNQGNRS